MTTPSSNAASVASSWYSDDALSKQAEVEATSPPGLGPR